MGRRVERQREPELLGPSRELRQIGNDAYRADRDVPGADREPFGVVEDRQRPVHGFPIVERLPHSHEHDVGRLAERRVERHFANLAHDLPGLEVPAEAHAAGSAKNAAVGATRLRRNAECTTLSLGNQDRLDLGTVREPPEELSGAIARELSGGQSGCSLPPGPLSLGPTGDLRCSMRRGSCENFVSAEPTRRC